MIVEAKAWVIRQLYLYHKRRFVRSMRAMRELRPLDMPLG